jgi:hypothetical protein
MGKSFSTFTLVLSILTLCIMQISCSEDCTECPQQNPQSNNFGKLVVNSTPSGAKIYLLGTYSGKVTPDSISNLDPGIYEVSLYLLNYDTSYFDATIFANLTTTKDIVLIDSLPPVEFSWGGGGTSDSTHFSFLANQDILLDSVIVNRPIDATGNYIREKYTFNKEAFPYKNEIGELISYDLPYILNGHRYYPKFPNTYKFDFYGQKASGTQAYFHIDFQRSPFNF